MQDEPWHACVFSDWFRFVGQSKAFDGFYVFRPRRFGYGRHQPDRHITLAEHGQDVGDWPLTSASMQYTGLGCPIGLSLAMERPRGSIDRIPSGSGNLFFAWKVKPNPIPLSRG